MTDNNQTIPIPPVVFKVIEQLKSRIVEKKVKDKKTGNMKSTWEIARYPTKLEDCNIVMYKKSLEVDPKVYVEIKGWPKSLWVPNNVKKINQKIKQLEYLRDHILAKALRENVEFDESCEEKFDELPE